MKKWIVVAILAISQFVMVLDSTVMNVSISTVAKDLGTTISGLQAAITMYALTMAALMLTGGKIGEIWGRHRAFRIGSIVYGIGSLITALSPNLAILLLGWSLVEGVGAILVIPAIAALAAINYSGRSRVIAFSMLGAATGLAAAMGPIIGGAVTTYLSWRFVFAAETLVMIGVLLLAGRMKDKSTLGQTSLDIPSSLLSASGMALLVFGILQSKSWGWIDPLAKPEIGGHEIAPLGISLVSYLILAGIMVLWWFFERQKKLESEFSDPLLKVSLLKIPVLRSGLSVFMSQYFTIAAVFFVIPVYLQTILGYDALKTGVKLIPLSIGLLIFSAAGSRMSASRSARGISRWGQLGMSLGSLLVLGSINQELNNWLFWVGMFVLGSGFGLLASQLGNINMSAVGTEDTAQAGGLQGTFQNLGSSLGTAIAGSIFMLTLTSGFTAAVNSNPDLTQSAKTQISAKAETGLQVVSQSQAERYVVGQGGSQSTARTVSRLYEHSQLNALREAMFVVFAVSILSIVFSKNLPAKIDAGQT